MNLSVNIDNFGIPLQEEIKKPHLTVNELDHFIIEEFSRDEKEKEMDALKKLEEMQKRIGNILKETKIESKLNEAKSSDSIDSDESGNEDEYFNKITDDVLEDFANGLLITLGEMELDGKIPKIESGEQARAALLAVIRRLYIKKNVLGKMSRIFARYGAKQFLRKQRAAMGKTMT